MSVERDALGRRKARRPVRYTPQIAVGLDADARARVEALKVFPSTTRLGARRPRPRGSTGRPLRAVYRRGGAPLCGFGLAAP